VNAEDPAHNFRPAPGTVTSYREPAGPGVRIDSAAYPGFTVTPDYDSMIAKLVVWAPTRAQAIARLARAIDEYEIGGVPTTLPLLRALCDHQTVTDARYGTATLEAFAAEHFLAGNGMASTRSAALRQAQDDNALRPAQGRSIPHDDNALRRAQGRSIPHDDNGVEARAEMRVEVNDKLYRVRLIDLPPSLRQTPSQKNRPAPRTAHKKRAITPTGNEVPSPMHGVVVEIAVKEGAAVEQGSVVAVVEAMKMMNEIRAHKSGTVSKIHVKAGDTVESNSPLVTID
jgi:acetyl-CoA/propionyl-CoA carboxylase biotin carboxyl carrier protein